MFSVFVSQVFSDLASVGGSVVKNLPANSGDVGSIPGSGKSPPERNSNPHQYPCLGNSTDREAWWATVHGSKQQQSIFWLHCDFLFDPLIKSMLFNFHKFVGFPVFFLFLIYNYIQLWLEKVLYMVSIFSMYSYIFCSLEHDMFWKYSMCIWEICTFVTVWSVQYITVRSCWFVVLFKFSVSLFIFLVVLLLRVGYWCLPNIVVQLFLFISINFCFMFWWLLWAAWKFIILINLCCIEPFIST